MRLINTSTMKMEEFISGANCVYAILSHTWGEEEVSFLQYSTPEAPLMAGYHKIERSCALALRSRLPHLWVDTCCIDKSSSAELSEAINSMYRWYRDAAVCYVHLSDMKHCEVSQSRSEDDSFVSKNFQMLQACRWFTRGWTLQELLAPDNVEFYDQDWVPIGTKKTMWDLLSSITGIQPKHLWMSQEASVAQKMSWAANRQTTRTEDIAYSLLGLFNVNMPLLYGEGEKAFKRLQHEILQSTNDESIFAWTDDRVWTSGLLAESPANFAKSGDFVPFDHGYRKPYTMTNQGLQIELCHLDFENEKAGRFETPLNCETESSWLPGKISLHMTYYTNKFGALRALRTGPFQVSVGLSVLSGGTEKYDLFHIDNFRRPRLPPHYEIPLYRDFFEEVSCNDSLTLRLNGGLHAEDISILEDTDMTKPKGFCIGNRNKGYLAGRSNQTYPMIHVYWSSYDPTYLTLDIHPSRFDITQKLFNTDKHPLSGFKLQDGNSLATWFSGDEMLFIALSGLQPWSPLKQYIDIQLDSIVNGAEGIRQLASADPLRAHKNYPGIHFLTTLHDFKEPLDKGSGQVMYGKEILV